MSDWTGVAKGLRTDVYLQTIFKYCLMPHFEEKIYNEQFDYDRELSEWFQIETREIYHIKALRPFKLPGRLWHTSNKISTKIGRREITQGFRMLVRIDVRDGGAVDVEHWPKKNVEQVFRLTREEWDLVKDHVTVVFKTSSDIESRYLKNLLKYHSDFVKRELGCSFKVKLRKEMK